MPSRRHFLPDERLTSGALDTFAAGFDRFYGNIDNLRSHWKSRGTVKQSPWFSLPWARKALSAVASLIPVRHYLDSSARTLWKRKLIGPLPGNTKNTRYWREIQSYLDRSTNVALSSILTLLFFSFSICLFYFARSFFMSDKSVSPAYRRTGNRNSKKNSWCLHCSRVKGAESTAWFFAGLIRKRPFVPDKAISHRGVVDRRWDFKVIEFMIIGVWYRTRSSENLVRVFNLFFNFSPCSSLQSKPDFKLKIISTRQNVLINR